MVCRGSSRHEVACLRVIASCMNSLASLQPPRRNRAIFDAGGSSHPATMLAVSDLTGITRFVSTTFGPVRVQIGHQYMDSKKAGQSWHAWAARRIPPTRSVPLAIPSMLCCRPSRPPALRPGPKNQPTRHSAAPGTCIRLGMIAQTRSVDEIASLGMTTLG